MVALLDIKNGEIIGWIMASDTHELRRKFQAIFGYPDDGRRQECLNELYQMEFPETGKHMLQSGYILLVE